MMRRYESKWTRFSQPDPSDGSYSLADPQSLNRYSYTQNDPVNFIDPNGLMPSIWPTYGADVGGVPTGFWGGGFDLNDRHRTIGNDPNNPSTGREIISDRGSDSRYIVHTWWVDDDYRIRYYNETPFLHQDFSFMSFAGGVSMGTAAVPTTSTSSSSPKGEGFLEALKTCVFEHYGLTSFSTRAAMLALSASVPKSWFGRFVAPGSSGYTNLLSELALRNKRNMGISLMRTTNGVRAVARFMPYLNSGVLIYDGLSISSCVKERLTGRGLNSLTNTVENILNPSR